MTSKYDGNGIKKFGRAKCKLVIVLDISGSMGDSFNYKETKSKLDIAKSVMKSMLEHISPEDYYSLILFDDVA